MNIDAYILRIVPYKEGSAIITALSRDGYLTFSARGLFKPNAKHAAAIQPFQYVGLELSEGKAGHILKTATIKGHLDHVLTDVTRLSALYVINEITLRLLSENEDGISIFPYFDQAITAIVAGDDVLTVLYLFLAVSLKIAGVGLDVDQCVFSGSKKAIGGISYQDGGLVAKAYLNQPGVITKSSHQLKIIRYAFKYSVEDFRRVAFSPTDILPLLNELVGYTDEMASIKLHKYADFSKIYR